MPKPYHQSIVSELVRVHHQTHLYALGSLIAETELLHDHDEVLTAWREAYIKVFGKMLPDGQDLFGLSRVFLHIAAEKERVTKEAAAKAAAPTQTEGDVPVCDNCHRKMFLAGKTYHCDCITHH